MIHQNKKTTGFKVVSYTMGCLGWYAELKNALKPFINAFIDRISLNYHELFAYLIQGKLFKKNRINHEHKW